MLEKNQPSQPFEILSQRPTPPPRSAVSPLAETEIGLHRCQTVPNDTNCK